MAFLVIDIGNTFIKVAVFAGGDLIEIEHYQEIDNQIINALIAKHAIKKGIISSVKKDKGDWEISLAEQITLIYFNRAMAAGVKNHYKTPHTLGLDRLAAVMGAINVFPGKGSLVIDAGTCITYDWIDSEGNYFGGSISPGLQMRYKALNHYTAGLPLTEADAGFNESYGDDTRHAILSGVQNGIKYELEGFIKSYQVQQDEPNIILSGGDGIFFDTLLKNSIFAPYIKNEPYLVLKGLNAAIQEHND